MAPKIRTSRRYNVGKTTSINRTPTNENGSGTNRTTDTGNRSRSKYRGAKRNDTYQSNFKGKSAEMKGHVFQVHAEQQNRRQFEETTRQLEVLTSFAFSK